MVVFNECTLTSGAAALRSKPPNPSADRRRYAANALGRAFSDGAAAALLAALTYAVAASAADENPVTRLDLPRIEVIGTTPLPGVGLSPKQVPANVQTLSADDVKNTRAPDAASIFERSLNSANINDTQGNPFLSDLNLRGFTASPVLGTPQGVSLFVDGVRVNQSFGDTVDWDLIPRNAIANVSVIPGSNPVFGLNTLGGAIAIATKSGYEFPGTVIEGNLGSFGRRNAAFETGGHGETLDYYIAGNGFDQRGWAAHSSSRVRQLFGKTGFQDEATDIDFSVNLAANRFEGSQTLPLSWLDTPREVYSYPDITSNRFIGLNLKANQYLTRELLVGADLYYRRLKSSIFNSNINAEYDPTLPTDTGNFPAVNVTNDIQERRTGVTVQLTYVGAVLGRKNNAVIGVSRERGRVRFEQNNQEATISIDRGTLSDLPIMPSVDLRSTNTYDGIYATDTLQLTDKLAWTVSGRQNRANVVLDDQLGTALNGNHAFSRFNPATGLTFNPSATLTTFVAYNEGMRVPTAVELSCADPLAPCSLPNAFASDPELKPVVSRTIEIGARGKAAGLTWFVAGFDTELRDDIQFISAGGSAASAGYFQNVGTTRRRGIESGFETRIGGIRIRANYAFLDATYRTPLILNSPNNSTAAPISCATCTEIAVAPGDRLPGIARHLLKLNAEYGADEAWSIVAGVSGQTGVYARGDENNRDLNGRLPGFFVFNLEGKYRPGPRWEIAVRVENLFDRTYSTFGQLGQNRFTAANRTFDATGAGWTTDQFRSIAAPRTFGLTVTYLTDDDRR